MGIDYQLAEDPTFDVGDTWPRAAGQHSVSTADGLHVLIVACAFGGLAAATVTLLLVAGTRPRSSPFAAASHLWRYLAVLTLDGWATDPVSDVDQHTSLVGAR